MSQVGLESLSINLNPAKKESEMTCNQTIVNILDHEKRWCDWSRAFAIGMGSWKFRCPITVVFPIAL